MDSDKIAWLWNAFYHYDCKHKHWVNDIQLCWVNINIMKSIRIRIFQIGDIDIFLSPIHQRCNPILLTFESLTQRWSLSRPLKRSGLLQCVSSLHCSAALVCLVSALLTAEFLGLFTNRHRLTILRGAVRHSQGPLCPGGQGQQL